MKYLITLVMLLLSGSLSASMAVYLSKSCYDNYGAYAYFGCPLFESVESCLRDNTDCIQMDINTLIDSYISNIIQLQGEAIAMEEKTAIEAHPVMILP